MADYLHWFIFSVVFALLHLIVAIIVFLLYRLKIQFTKIFMDGSLIFFAMSLTASSCGEFLDCQERHQQADTVAFSCAVFIFIACTTVYTSLIRDMFIGRTAKKRISPEIVTKFSVGASVGAIFYGSALFLLMGLG